MFVAAREIIEFEKKILFKNTSELHLKTRKNWEEIHFLGIERWTQNLHSMEKHGGYKAQQFDS